MGRRRDGSTVSFTDEVQALVEQAEEDDDLKLTRGLFELLRPLRERMQGATEEEKRRTVAQFVEDA